MVDALERATRKAQDAVDSSEEGEGEDEGGTVLSLKKQRKKKAAAKTKAKKKPGPKAEAKKKPGPKAGAKRGPKPGAKRGRRKGKGKVDLKTQIRSLFTLPLSGDDRLAVIKKLVY